MSTRPSSPVKLRDCYVGIDGAKNGWAVASMHSLSREIRLDFMTDLGSVFRDCLVAAIDIPIGLEDEGDRVCDKEARAQLQEFGKHNSLFPIPPRMVVYQPTYEAAKLIAPSVWDGRKPSLQAFHLFKKIIEVEGLLLSDPKLKLKIFETHPELGFALLAPGQCPEKKRTVNGCAQRLDALRGIWIEFGWTDEEFHAYRAQARLSRDDATDALIALFTAIRIVSGAHIPIPPALAHDALGLRKQMMV